jgi:hypothetical protein
LYDDACDVGIALKNYKTGNITRWSIMTTERDSDRDLVAWVLAPTPESLRKWPEMYGHKMIILND